MRKNLLGLTALVAMTGILASCGDKTSGGRESDALTPEVAQAHAAYFVEVERKIMEESEPPGTFARFNRVAGLTEETEGRFVDFWENEEAGEARICMKFSDGMYLAQDMNFIGKAWVTFSMDGCSYPNSSNPKPASVKGSIDFGAAGEGMNGDETASKGEWVEGKALMGDWTPSDILAGTTPGSNEPSVQKLKAYKATATSDAGNLGLELAAILADYRSLGADPTIVFSPVKNGFTKMTLTLGEGPVPTSKRTIIESSFRVSATTDSVTGFVAQTQPADITGVPFCVVIENHGQIAVTSNEGFQARATGCNPVNADAIGN